MAELLEHEAMELEPMDEEEKEQACKDEEEKEQACKSLSDSKEPLEAPKAADSGGTTAMEQECISKSVSFLPRNKEELERTIKTIQGAITGDILPRLHKCLASAVRTAPASPAAARIKLGQRRQSDAGLSAGRPSWSLVFEFPPNSNSYRPKGRKSTSWSSQRS